MALQERAEAHSCHILEDNRSSIYGCMTYLCHWPQGSLNLKLPACGARLNWNDLIDSYN